MLRAPRTRAVIAWWKRKRSPEFLYTKSCCTYCNHVMPGPLSWCGNCGAERSSYAANFYKDPWPWNTYWSVARQYDDRAV
jgi:hypothetical protein